MTSNSPTSANELKRTVKEIQKSDKALVNADKTQNIYHVSKNDYFKLLDKNITKDYMKTNYETVKKVNIEAASIATNLELEDRIEQLSESKAFITLKDHKENFQNDPKCRLINPAKSNIGKISKQLIQEINKEIREKLELKQWQSTDEVLKWFNKIENKKSKSFLQMDIVEFYPSITKELLEKAIDWASTITPISKSTKEIILHSRKSFLFSRHRDNEEPESPQHGQKKTASSMSPWVHLTGRRFAS